MDNNILNLAAFANNGIMQNPEEALLDAINEIKEGNGAFTGKKVLILALDDTDESYSVSFIQAGMHMSECLALCEIGKSVFKDHMGY